jgi:formylglycine-generating enzyme required for sulfatase activity
LGDDTAQQHSVVPSWGIRERNCVWNLRESKMVFDLGGWQSEVHTWWVNHASRLKTIPLDSAYAVLAASAWLPLLTAYSQDPGSALTTLVGITAGIGSNLVANIVQRAYDNAQGGEQVANQARENPQTHAELDAVIQATHALEAAQKALGKRWDDFARQLTQEIATFPSQSTLLVTLSNGTTVGGSVIGRDTTVTGGGDFVARNQQKFYGATYINLPAERASELMGSSGDRDIIPTSVGWSERNVEAVRSFLESCSWDDISEDLLLRMFHDWGLITMPQGGYFTIGGAILFGPNDRIPRGFRTDVQVDDRRRDSIRNFNGRCLASLYRELSSELSHLWRGNWEAPQDRDADGRPIRVDEYPRTAIVEALVNFIIHRNYEIDDLAYITLGDSYVEFVNPGLSPYSPEQLLSADKPLRPKYTRNRLLIKVFTRASLNQRQGSGIIRMRRALIQHGNVRQKGTAALEVENDTDNERFRLRIYASRRPLGLYNLRFQAAPFRPPPDLVSLRAAYTDYLLSAHRYLDLKGIPQVEKVATLMPLEEVFVPLHARPAAPEADTWQRLRLAGREVGELEETLHLGEMLAPGESSAPLPIDEVLNRETTLVILGDPGAGKSTLLRHLALHMARDGEGPLPILLPLNAYAEALQREEIGLQAYLARYYAVRRKELEGIEALFDAALAEGQVVVLLDGLDEVHARRVYINRLVEDFVAVHREREGNRFVVTSRIVGYRDAPLAGANWPVYTLTDWEREEIEHFVARWTLAFEITTHGDIPEARAAAEEERQGLLAAIVPGSGIERLASNPLLLTIMALIKRQRVTLPRERVRLFELYLETLTNAWNKARALDKRPVGPDIDYLETAQVLAPLSLWLREQSPVTGLVGRDQVEGWLTDYYQREWGESHGPARRHAREFLGSVHRYSNLLIERGEGQYGFLHLTFEEMLAAKGIALLEDQEGLPAAMEVIYRHLLDPAWRETLMLTVGVLGIVKQNPFRAGRILRELCAEDVPGTDQGQNVVIAGQALADVGEAGVDRASAAVVIAHLVRIMQNREMLAPTRRDAGHLLGQLGWEPEDGLDVWVEIPSGPFLYGSGKEPQVIQSPYRIGAYPVTNRQFACFVDAGGYERRECWSEQGWAWRIGVYDRKAPDYLKDWLSRRPPEKRDQPFWWKDARWGSPLCPVVGISWFEAEAYCHWLTLEVGLDLNSLVGLRLPTEEEWERAVRGVDGREYPWGEKWDRKRLNSAEWWAGRRLSSTDESESCWDTDKYNEAGPTPTAVVTFPEGVSPVGLWDAAGNVWEWTGSPYCKGEQRVVRGGSWTSDRKNVHCVSRKNNDPSLFSQNVGFRVVFPVG